MCARRSKEEEQSLRGTCDNMYDGREAMQQCCGHHGQEAEPEMAELKMRFLFLGGQHSWNHESEHQRGQYGSNVLEMKPDSDEEMMR